MPVVRRCRLGYSDGRSLRPYLQRHRLSIKRATEMGLFWPKGARGETMAGRIVIPELRGGQCIWMLGRVLDEERQPKYRGLSLPKPILGYERVRGRPRVFVTEGAFDYLTGVAWGCRCARSSARRSAPSASRFCSGLAACSSSSTATRQGAKPRLGSRTHLAHGRESSRSPRVSRT